MYLTSLRHIGQRTLRFLKLGWWLHEELVETRGTKCVTTMNEYSWYVVACIVILFTQLTSILINELIDKFLYFGTEFIGSLFSLPKEESCGVFEFLHPFYYFKFYIKLSIERCLNIEN